jgi:hypothetical protein
MATNSGSSSLESKNNMLFRLRLQLQSFSQCRIRKILQTFVANYAALCDIHTNQSHSGIFVYRTRRRCLILGCRVAFSYLCGYSLLKISIYSYLVDQIYFYLLTRQTQQSFELSVRHRNLYIKYLFNCNSIKYSTI